MTANARRLRWVHQVLFCLYVGALPVGWDTPFERRLQKPALYIDQLRDYRITDFEPHLAISAWITLSALLLILIAALNSVERLRSVIDSALPLVALASPMFYYAAAVSFYGGVELERPMIWFEIALAYCLILYLGWRLPARVEGVSLVALLHFVCWRFIAYGPQRVGSESDWIVILSATSIFLTWAMYLKVARRA